MLFNKYQRGRLPWEDVVTIDGLIAAVPGADWAALDLREAAFPDLTFASTQMHHMITKVLRRDRDGAARYEVWVMRSP